MRELVRQEYLIDNDKTSKTTVHIIGCGATGSHLALLLAKTGLVLHVYDYDEVEEHNIGNQIFTKQYVGLNKATAVAHLVYDRYGELFNYDNVIPHPIKVTGDMVGDMDIVVLAVDSVEARVDIGKNLNAKLIICPGIPANIRDDQMLMATGTVEIFFNDLEGFNERYIKRYENRTDEQAQEELRKDLEEWNKGCSKQSYELLCIETALTCAKLIMTYVLQVPDLTYSERYDLSAVLPIILRKNV